MKIIDNILHAVSGIENRFMGTEELWEYREECRQEVLKNFNGTYDDIDKDHVDWYDTERRLADEELARRHRR